MRYLISAPLVFVTLVSASGCESSGDSVVPCEEDSRAEEYAAGTSELGPAGYTLRLMDSDPGPPELGDNRWTIEITNPAGVTAPGLDLKVSSFMVDHKHRSPIRPTILDRGEGRYSIDPVNLFMPGYWEVTINVSDSGATAEDDSVDLDVVIFKICIDT